MGIKVRVNIDFEKVKTEFLNQIEERVLVAFSAACKEAVNYAKGTGSEFDYREFQTQTGALRASMGYQLYRDGKLIEEYFEKSQGGTEEGATKGINEGRKLANETAKEINAPIVGIIVAGMSYAVHVESKGYDVLSGATLQLPSLLNKYLEEMFSNTGVSYAISQ